MSEQEKGAIVAERTVKATEKKESWWRRAWRKPWVRKAVKAASYVATALGGFAIGTKLGQGQESDCSCDECEEPTCENCSE